MLCHLNKREVCKENINKLEDILGFVRCRALSIKQKYNNSTNEWDETVREIEDILYKCKSNCEFEL